LFAFGGIADMNSWGKVAMCQEQTWVCRNLREEARLVPLMGDGAGTKRCRHDVSNGKSLLSIPVLRGVATFGSGKTRPPRAIRHLQSNIYASARKTEQWDFFGPTPTGASTE
jgi:hypothetical protein